MAISVPVTPNTEVRLVQVPIEINEKNQINFETATEQYNYFNGLTKKVYNNFTYQRKDGTITVPECVDDIYLYNYVMYRNVGFSNKWFYAYIVESTFSSPNSTTVKIKTDVFQTWQFDLTYEPVFVEREHVNDDTIGAHTVPEGLELGEYVTNGSPIAIAPDKLTQNIGATSTINTQILICFLCSKFMNDVFLTEGGKFYNRQYSGLTLFAVETKSSADKVISGFAKQGKADNIISIFLAPKEFFQGCKIWPYTFKDEHDADQTVQFIFPAESSNATTLLDTTTYSMNSTLNGYVPKNNKLFTYPYNYLYVSNNAGGDAIFRYEDFKDHTPKFYMGGSLGQGCSIRLAPVDYKKLEGGAENYAYALTGMKYPVCAWSSDYYTNWLTQNGTNMLINIANQGIKGAAYGAMTGNPAIMAAGAGANILTAALSSAGEIDKASKIPDQAYGNTNCSDVSFAWHRMFSGYRMSIRAEYARIVDDFFSVFGYKVNVVKMMNIKGRTNWNYVKTNGCYIKANIPQEDLIELQSMFDNGVTFWHNASTFGDYSQSNGFAS